MGFPNTIYDPVKGHALYERYLREMTLADELGFDGVCVNEHHGTAYSMMPTCALMAATLIQRTKRAKIWGIIYVFTHRPNYPSFESRASATFM